MNEKQWQTLMDILNSSDEMSEAYKQRFIGVAYGLELANGLSIVPGPMEKEEKQGA